jgi:hypothetical protein
MATGFLFHPLVCDQGFSQANGFAQVYDGKKEKAAKMIGAIRMASLTSEPNFPNRVLMFLSVLLMIQKSDCRIITAKYNNT